MVSLVAFPALLLAVAVGSAAIAVLAARKRATPGGTPLAVLLAAATWWAAAYAVQLLQTDVPSKLLFSKLAYLAIAVVPIAWLWFMLEYTGRQEWLTPWRLGGLAVVPVLSLVVIWTAPGHDLFWVAVTRIEVGGLVRFDATRGPVFWVFLGYVYLLLAAGTLLLLQMLLLSEETYRGQSALLLTGTTVPWLASVAFVADVGPNLNLTPATFAITGLTFLLAMHRYQLLDVAPVAREVTRDEMVEHMRAGVLIVDEQRRVVDANPAVREILDHSGPLIGERLSTVCPALAEAAFVDGRVVTPTELALTGPDGRERYYDVRSRSFTRAAGLLTGTLLSLRDVTERRRREQRLDVLNRALRHDLRNEANVVLNRTELAIEQAPELDQLETIRERVLEMVDLSEKVRQVEQTLDTGGVTTLRTDIAPAVEQAVDTVRREYPGATYGVDLPETATVRATTHVQTAIENAVENAVEHNDHDEPRVTVTVVIPDGSDEPVEVRVADNGPGIPERERDILVRGRETPLEHVSGLGLWLINWLVTESGGDVHFTENDPRGSVVTMRLPAAEPGAEDGTAAETQSTRSTR